MKTNIRITFSHLQRGRMEQLTGCNLPTSDKSCSCCMLPQKTLSCLHKKSKSDFFHTCSNKAQDLKILHRKRTAQCTAWSAGHGPATRARQHGAIPAAQPPWTALPCSSLLLPCFPWRLSSDALFGRTHFCCHTE